MSQLEDRIMKILLTNKIAFIREKTFTDLRKGKYRFDFYCPDIQEGVLIEVQGEQHYIQNSKFFKTKKEFNAAKERDRRKISHRGFSAGIPADSQDCSG